MLVFVIGCVIGMAWLQVQPELPGLPFLCLTLGGGGVATLVALTLPRRRAVVVLAIAGTAGLLLGAGWAGVRAHWRLADGLAPQYEGVDLMLDGVVIGLPQVRDQAVRFGFAVTNGPAGVPRRLLLSWYRERAAAPDAALPSLRPGDQWRLTVRLRRPHGNFNPHGFDYEAWLLEQGWRATGYVRPLGGARLGIDAGPAHWPDRTRAAIRDRFAAALVSADGMPRPYAGLLVALAIGDQSAIPGEQWNVFARTGITHLVSISGLHVTMLGGLCYALAVALWRFLVRRSALMARRLEAWPAPVCGALAGALAALVYAGLAGFAIPVQRTLYMLGVALLAVLNRRQPAPMRILVLALLLVIVIDPWAVLAAGFWLSFGAVAAMLYTLRALQAYDPAPGIVGRWRRVWAGWWRAQWAVTLAGIPALLALFQQFSLVSPIANALAIPVVGVVVTPLCLLAAIPKLEWVLPWAHGLTEALMAAVAWLGGQPFAVWQQAAPPVWCVALALLGTGVVLHPRWPLWRLGGLAGFLPLILIVPERPVEGAWRLRVLDVGQGLAVHVQTRSHDLLFDTGPRYAAEIDSGQRVIAPYLRAVGVRALDLMVISHEDSDHSGGALSLFAAIPVRAWRHSLSERSALWPFLAGRPGGAPCRDGESWLWDGVEFRFLHPPLGFHGQGNAGSCVLRVSSTQGSALLTADIEAAQESALARRHGDALRADVLLAPHHGSATSSSAEFVHAVAPGAVVFSVGYRNRFGHPRDEVVSRYREVGATAYRSDEAGAVLFEFGPEGVRGFGERQRHPRYWHGR